MRAPLILMTTLGVLSLAPATQAQTVTGRVAYARNAPHADQVLSAAVLGGLRSGTATKGPIRMRRREDSPGASDAARAKRC